jgi:fatty acid desaturase
VIRSVRIETVRVPDPHDRHHRTENPPAATTETMSERSTADRSVAGGRLSWNRTWSLAVAFGLASVPWTYGFVVGLKIPLWPSFVASATFYATDADGLTGLSRAYASNLSGVAYAAATVAVVDAVFGGGPVALSVVVGAFMFLASLHDFVRPLSFTPGAFFGYATLFSVHAAGASVAGVGGLAGETLAAVVGVVVGAAIGLGTDGVSKRLA